MDFEPGFPGCISQLKNTEVGLSGSQKSVSRHLKSGCDPYSREQKMKSSPEALLEEFSKNDVTERL